jgi:hypothetical protein
MGVSGAGGFWAEAWATKPLLICEIDGSNIQADQLVFGCQPK